MPGDPTVPGQERLEGLFTWKGDEKDMEADVDSRAGMKKRGQAGRNPRGETEQPNPLNAYGLSLLRKQESIIGAEIGVKRVCKGGANDFRIAMPPRPCMAKDPTGPWPEGSPIT